MRCNYLYLYSPPTQSILQGLTAAARLNWGYLYMKLRCNYNWFGAKGAEGDYAHLHITLISFFLMLLPQTQLILAHFRYPSNPNRNVHMMRKEFYITKHFAFLMYLLNKVK